VTPVSVVGAGAVGRRVVRGLTAAPGELALTVYDHRPEATAALAREGHPHVIASTVSVDHEWRPPLDTRLVIITCGAPQAHVARRALDAGAAVVSTSDDPSDVLDLMDLAGAADKAGLALAVGVAMAPGLSGYLARVVADGFDDVDEIHVAVHGTGGPDCARQHHRALASGTEVWHDLEWRERPGGSGRELCWFPDPVGPRDCYRYASAEPRVMVRAFPGVRRVSARMSATRRDRLTAWLPMLRPPHEEGGVGAMRVEVRGVAGAGRHVVVSGVAEHPARVCAAVATSVARRILGGEVPPGLNLPGDERDLAYAVVHDVRGAGIPLMEYVGSEAITSW
jgi:saccharopine dehydrogenase-like NADP-dependent oxidoreductase